MTYIGALQEAFGLFCENRVASLLVNLGILGSRLNV